MRLKYWLSMIVSAAPSATSMYVRKPAGRPFLSRSKPTSPPAAIAQSTRSIIDQIFSCLK